MYAHIPDACFHPSSTHSSALLCMYNLCVVECRLAAALHAKHLGATSEEAAAITTLQEVEPMIAASEHGPGLDGGEGSTSEGFAA
jgi:hypothetical protein